MPNDLPVTEDLDFHYLLSLMPPLFNEPEYAWLPELFSLVGHEALIQLCKYAGGEIIKIPTLEELANSVEALQWFYDIHISKKRKVGDLPENLVDLYRRIRKVYDANNS